MGDSRTSLLTRLHGQLLALPVLLEGIPREALDRRAGDKWSVTENVAHLARHHEITLDRIQRILSEQEPSLPAYRADQDPSWPAWQARSFEDIAQRLHALRTTLIAAVEVLTAEQLSRTGRHSRFGPLSLHAWLEFFLVHEGHHLYVIVKRARGLE